MMNIMLATSRVAASMLMETTKNMLEPCCCCCCIFLPVRVLARLPVLRCIEPDFLVRVAVFFFVCAILDPFIST